MIRHYTTQTVTLTLHDALPISERQAETVECGSSALPQAGCRALESASSNTSSAVWRARSFSAKSAAASLAAGGRASYSASARSEENTSELQSRPHLVCRLLLEK